MKSPIPKERLRVSNWIVQRLLSDCEGRCSVSRQLVYSPPGSLLSTRSTHGRLKMVARKLKAAIYECVLARGLCNAVASTGCLRGHYPAGGRNPCYLSSAQYGSSAQQLCVELRSANAAALVAKLGWRDTFGSREKRESDW